MNYDFYPDLYNKEKLEFDYLYENRSFVLGSLFGGNKIIIQKVFALMDDLLINKMIKNNIINIDKDALAFLVKNNPQYFSIYCRKDKIHLSYLIFYQDLRICSSHFSCINVVNFYSLFLIKESYFI